ncbi:MAG TPA: S1 RNA-binding domain-containing protein [Firmicutes bacterium]|nr:S1 RNA-binding domain-containing protein [Bacillota bacterium]
MAFFPEGILYDTRENQLSLRNAASLQECIQNQKIVEARALLCDSQHNLFVDLHCMRGMIPREEGAIGIREGVTRDIAMISRVNKPVCFVVNSITEDRDGRPLALLSRKRAQEICMESYISHLTSGDVIPARVTHLEPFGCFVDIGCGIPSLIPIDAISVSRIAHPQDRFSVGQNIYAVIKSIESGKICLSHKELLGTWKQNAEFFVPGETVAGIIRSIEDYGIFVELTPNLAGLAERKDGIKVGQQASVYIKSLIPEKMKVKLIIVDAFSAAYQHNEYPYFIREGHIDCWQYSPPESEKLIVSRFE